MEKDEVRAILIDPYKEEVKEVTYNGVYTEIHKLIDCTCFTAPSLTNGESIYCDDEGLLKDEVVPFITKLYSPNHPLVGKCLIMGTDMETGDSISTTLTVKEVESSIMWH